LRANIAGKKITDYKTLFIPQLNKDVLCCDHEAIIICGTYDIQDESKFTAGFITALAYYLASEIAQDLSGNAKLALSLKQEAAVRLDKAKYDSKAGTRAKAIDSNSIVLSR
jgi:hypothetical protein